MEARLFLGLNEEGRALYVKGDFYHLSKIFTDYKNGVSITLSLNQQKNLQVKGGRGKFQRAF